MWRSLLGRACGEIPFHPTGERSVPRWVQGALEPPARVRTHIHTHRVCPCLRSHSPYRFQDCHSDRHVRMGRRRPRPPMDRQADRVPRRGALSSPGCASSKGLVAAQAEAPLNPCPGRLPVVATSRGEGSPAVGTEAADPLVSRGRAGCPGRCQAVRGSGTRQPQHRGRFCPHRGAGLPTRPPRLCPRLLTPGSCTLAASVTGCPPQDCTVAPSKVVTTWEAEPAPGAQTREPQRVPPRPARRPHPPAASHRPGLPGPGPESMAVREAGHRGAQHRLGGGCWRPDTSW